jgi:hypothetical protein
LFHSENLTLYQACLTTFGNNPELVIMKILEDDLPEPLRNLNRSLARETSTDRPKGILDSRKNVYDHDEFDILHGKQLDTSKVIFGKKE